MIESIAEITSEARAIATLNPAATWRYAVDMVVWSLREIDEHNEHTLRRIVRSAAWLVVALTRLP